MQVRGAAGERDVRVAEAQGINTDRGPPAAPGGAGSGGVYDPDFAEGDDIDEASQSQECTGNFFQKKACEIKNAGKELVGDVLGAAKKVASCFDGWGATCTKWAGVVAGGLAVAGLCVITVGAGCVAAGFIAAGALQGALWCKGGSLGGCAAKGALVAGVTYLAGGIVAKVAAPVLRPLVAPLAARVASLASRMVPASASRAFGALGSVAARSRARVSGTLGRFLAKPPPTSTQIVEQTARAEAGQGTAYLREYMRPGERLRFDLDPAKGTRYVGQATHRATAQSLEAQFPGRFAYRHRGPDFLDRTTGEVTELTTPRQVPPHMRRPDYPQDPQSYATYDVPGK
ncbi:MAG: hypothetical protein M3404_05450 [Actinomycetota bacterium]|nr:hypothetical protein [Actinomycetota bacterium]